MMSREPRQTASILSRRTLLGGAAALGAATALPGLSGTASAASGERAGSYRRFQSDSKTLTIASDASPANLDPQFADDAESILAILGIYEGLLALKGDKTDEYVGLL